MREILFKGKRVDNGEWVEGELLHDMKGKSWIYWTTPKELPIFFSRSAIVKSETVGQFTGLTDKNGKKIFEGDIIKVYETQEHAQNVSVFYKDGQFVVSHYALKLLSDRALQSEVIGNIHDNPELLTDTEPTSRAEILGGGE